MTGLDLMGGDLFLMPVEPSTNRPPTVAWYPGDAGAGAWGGGRASAWRMNGYDVVPSGGFASLLMTVHAIKLPCEVSAHTTGEGGNFSSPAMS
jgi:hypothetical protein